MNFTSLNLEEPLLKAIEELNYQKPTPIQSQVIPLLLEDTHDLVGLAQTGTGKTAAFGLPLLQLIELNDVIPQALILCPTRELCIQITNDLENYAKHLPKMRVLSVYGGAPIDKQIRSLKKGVHLLVATPGRLNDLIRRKKVDLSRIERVVLDEADEMLNMGFQEELDFILEELPADRNTLLFSATMPKSVQKIAEKYMNEPLEVTIGEKNASSEMVSHSYHMVYEKDRYKALKRVVDTYPDMYSIIFCRTRMDTHKIANQLMQDGYAVDSLHGDLSQPMRDRVMEKFRCRNFNILVATDVAARGLDVNNLTHVIHYHLPEDVEYYNHRSGRTGRAGSTGLSISIINPKEKFKIKRLEKILKKPFEFKLLSSGEEVCKAKLFHIVDRVKKVEIDKERIAPFLPEIYENFGGMNWQELIQRFVSLEFGRFLEEYQDLQDLNAAREEKSHTTPKQREGNFSLNQRVRLVLNFGKRDGFTLKDLILLVNRATKGYRVELGQIVLLQRKTLFEVEEDDVDLVMNSLNESSSFKKKKVIVMLDRDQSPEKMPSRRETSRRKSKSTRKFNKHRGKPKKRDAFALSESEKRSPKGKEDTMDVAVFVAKVISIIYFSAAFGGFLNKEFYKEVGEHLYNNTALTFIIGFMAIILGALILQFHPQWNKDWTALVTLIGWISLVKGVVLIVFPKGIHKLSKPFFTPTALKIFPFISLLMGILFGYFGFILGASA